MWGERPTGSRGEHGRSAEGVPATSTPGSMAMTMATAPPPPWSASPSSSPSPPPRTDGGNRSGRDVDAVQRFYGRWAALYDLVARHTPGVGWLRRRTIEGLELGPGDAAIDMGCGTGANLPILRRQVGPTGTVVGIDVTRGALRRADRSIRAVGGASDGDEEVPGTGTETGSVTGAMAGNPPGVHLLQADVTALPLRPDWRADAIVAAFVVGMLEHPARAVERWCDRLSPGGRLGLINAVPSRGRLGPLVNPPFRALVAISTPGRVPGRTDASGLSRLLERRVEAAHAALLDRAATVREDERWFGLVRTAVGRLPADPDE